MQYVIRPGDTLWGIAETYFGAPEKWTLIAQGNHLSRPSRLMVGERLKLRDELVTQRPANAPARGVPSKPSSEPQHAPSVIPGRAFLFVLADEIDPLRQKVVRKVMVNPKMAARVSTRLGRPVQLMPNPSIFGLQPTGPDAAVTMGRHAMNLKPSPFSSASTHPLGAPSFLVAASGSTRMRQRQQARPFTTPMTSLRTSTASPAKCGSPATSRR